MGMLQLAAAVSGAGKGLGRGLENMQNTMSTVALLGIRDEMDRNRMRETWGHEEGMLQKRQDFEVKQADTAHSRALDRMDQDHDFTASQARIGREEGRQKEGRDAERQKEMEAVKQKNRIDELMAQHGLSEKDALLKYKQELAKEGREHKYKVEEQNFKYGADVQLEKLRGQNRAHTGKEDYHDADAQGKVVESRIKGLQDELKSFPSEKRAAEIRKEIAKLQQQQNAMVGLPSETDTPRARVDISQFDSFRKASPAQSQAPPPSSAPSNLPRMGNVNPTPAELADFVKQYEAAQRTGTGIADVVEAFKNRFGRLPTQAEFNTPQR